MTKLIVDNEFWDLFPQAEIYLLRVNDLNNEISDEKDAVMANLLKQAAKAGEKFVPDEPISQNEVIAQWRQAFQKFKTKKGARSSIEALLKRVQKGNIVRPINPLVDLYNVASMANGVPIGAEDTSKITGDMHLGLAQGGEDFWPLGAEESAAALEGEICYYDDQGAVCRCFNWREAERTMITEESQQAVIVIEAINAQQAQRAQEAQTQLQSLLAEHLGVQAEAEIINIENKEATIA
ncbi:B3/4 domain-containing protein [Aerococcus kribbianus]|uniref:Phenylalanine--tRNA ligase beta subunit-related protein n=1 Tax=Aerococcus kribbianus TaxID=2999064 RepID=A0A9X3JE00_9LACT|nr:MULTISPECIES: phenylalanine--tRNA ligase beta subunit-related protein [unclassified Aerococcus]MCZ0718103.1 phenylalanine--tRNA ligase beta subunit-related protein [Aerococcus sp. YH-aer221]MCZ0726328.1 phenylalanine--tRNA ligase beta subunit-related protein [Aerococcus sp. YH-aer222]